MFGGRGGEVTLTGSVCSSIFSLCSLTAYCSGTFYYFWPDELSLASKASVRGVSEGGDSTFSIVISFTGSGSSYNLKTNFGVLIDGVTITVEEGAF